jgi:hypothetical protein
MTVTMAGTPPAWVTKSGNKLIGDATPSNIDVGDHAFSLIISDQENPTSATTVITWKITENSIPYALTLANQSTRMTLVDHYSLPSISDKEGETVTVTFGAAKPAYITYN